VLEQMAADGTLRARRSRSWNLFPVRHTVLAAPARAQELRDRVRDTVLGGHDPAELTVADAVLAVLAADGGVASTFTIREQHRHRDAFRALAHRVESCLPGLRMGVLWSLAARRAEAGGPHRTTGAARVVPARSGHRPARGASRPRVHLFRDLLVDRVE
jgi:hypothetical protein